MSKSNVLFGRLGNKDKDIKHFQHLLPTENIKNVIEPFGGSFAVIRKFYNDTDKYNLFVNDNDPDLIEIYKNPQEYSDLAKKLNDIANSVKKKDSNLVDYKKFLDIINENEDLKNHKLLDFWKVGNIVLGKLIKPKKNYNDTEHLNLMKKITFSFDDYMITLEKFKSDKKAFIFIDPPYLYADNSTYSQQKRKEPDMSDIIYKLLEYIKDKKTKAKVMIVINGNHLIKWLYKDFIKAEYIKNYGFSNKIVSHVVICNY